MQTRSRSSKILTLALSAILAAGTLMAQVFERGRELVQRTTDHLAELKTRGRRDAKQRERVDNALNHLSDFDRNLARHKFDKGRLDQAIDDVKNVVDHNTLEPRDRDYLTRDLEALRMYREERH